MKRTILFTILAFVFPLHTVIAIDKAQIIYTASEKNTVTLKKQDLDTATSGKSVKLNAGESYIFDPTTASQGLYHAIISDNHTSTVIFIFVHKALPSGFAVFSPAVGGILTNGLVVKFFDTLVQSAPKIMVLNDKVLVENLSSPQSDQLVYKIRAHEFGLEFNFSIENLADQSTALNFRYVPPAGLEFLPKNSEKTNDQTSASSNSATQSAPEDDSDLMALMAEYIAAASAVTSGKMTQEEQWALILPLQQKLNAASALRK